MKKTEEKALILSAWTSFILAFSVLVGVVSYIGFKIKQKRDDNDKWKDYDECGV